MPELWNSLPLEIRLAIITVALWAADAVATRTPNPFDNLIVRGLKRLRDRNRANGA